MTAGLHTPDRARTTALHEGSPRRAVGCQGRSGRTSVGTGDGERRRGLSGTRSSAWPGSESTGEGARALQAAMLPGSLSLSTGSGLNRRLRGGVCVLPRAGWLGSVGTGDGEGSRLGGADQGEGLRCRSSLQAHRMAWWQLEAGEAS